MEIRFSGLFEDWQTRARELLTKDVAPRDVVWVEELGQQPLFGGENGAGSNSSGKENTGAGKNGATVRTWGAPFEAQGKGVLRPYKERATARSREHELGRRDWWHVRSWDNYSHFRSLVLLSTENLRP